MNQSIFEQFIFPIRSKLYRFALRITGSAHEAEDVVQEVMEKIWKFTPEQSGQVQNWEAWCMTLTRNRSLDRNKHNSLRRHDSLETPLIAQVSSPSPAQSYENADMAARIKALIQELPEKQRLVMHLRDIEELTYEEIAQALEITLDMVKVNLHRARKAVREAIIKQELITV